MHNGLFLLCRSGGLLRGGSRLFRAGLLEGIEIFIPRGHDLLCCTFGQLDFFRHIVSSLLAVNKGGSVNRIDVTVVP